MQPGEATAVLSRSPGGTYSRAGGTLRVFSMLSGCSASAWQVGWCQGDSADNTALPLEPGEQWLLGNLLLKWQEEKPGPSGRDR